MEALFLVLALLVLAAVLLYPVWKRQTRGTGCGPCGTTTTTPSTTTGVCFPSVPWTVKSGLIDLRGCNDDIYIFANRDRVHFIEESP